MPTSAGEEARPSRGGLGREDQGGEEHALVGTDDTSTIAHVCEGVNVRN